MTGKGGGAECYDCTNSAFQCIQNCTVHRGSSVQRTEAGIQWLISSELFAWNADLSVCFPNIRTKIKITKLEMTLTLRQLMSYIYIYMEHPFLMFLDHTQRRSTVGRTPLDEWSARRRDLYLTTHETHNRQITMPPVGFEPTISAGERPQAAHLLRSNPTGGMDICLLWVSCVVR